MVSARNIKKILDDHPEIGFLPRWWIRFCTKRCNESGIVSSGAVVLFMGKRLSQIFFAEVISSADHIRIGLEDCKAAIKPATVEEIDH